MLSAALLALTAGAQPPPSGFAFNGVNYVSWWHDEYTYPAAQASLDALAATGADWAGVLVTWYMPHRKANQVAPLVLKTPTDAALAQAIAGLHARKVKVMLKPHIDVVDGTWRGLITPASKGQWFERYEAFLLCYASLAEAHGVEMLSIGTELKALSGPADTAYWRELIARVRSIYSGWLTYGANAVTADDEFQQIGFWDDLDYAGLDVYVPLTNQFAPSLTQLMAAWTLNSRGENMLATLQQWRLGHTRPVIFAEIGYRSADGTNIRPYDATSSAAYDPQEQADCLEAAVRVWSPEAAWMQGIFVWNWPVPFLALPNTDYTPRGKPAEDVLRAWYGGVALSRDVSAPASLGTLPCEGAVIPRLSPGDIPVRSMQPARW